jgi:multicomponent Na+:H+ antiporter subunit D
MSDLLALVVAVPIAVAVVPLIPLAVTRRAVAPLAALVGIGQLLAAAVLVPRVLDGSQLRYAVGGYTPPIGIELVGDAVSLVLVGLIGLATTVAVAQSRRTDSTSPYLYSQLLLASAGLAGLVVTGDVFNLYVFLEISGLAVYALVASRRSAPAAVAALRYLLVGTVGASLYLLGVGFLYISTGTLNMADMAAQLQMVGLAAPPVAIGLVLVVVGLAVKVALFPLHSWQPGAYRRAPPAVTTYMAAVVSTAAAYAIFRILTAVFTPRVGVVLPELVLLLQLAAAVSMLAGALFAVRQDDLRLVFAYSSVSQFGVIILGVLLLETAAQVGAVIQLVGHGLLKLGLFVAIAQLVVIGGGATLADLRGLGRIAPIRAAALSVSALALVGVPPTVGFIGKWQIAIGAIEAGVWPFAVLIIASTLITLAYVLRLIELLYFPVGTADLPVATDGGRPARAVVPVAVAIASVVLGLVAEWYIPVLTAAIGGVSG